MKPKKRVLRRYAIAMAGGMDAADLSAYQYGRHSVAGVTVYDFGDGYAVAVDHGKQVPERFIEEFGPWSLVETIDGWDVYSAGGAK